jgi:hypothetical protein
MSRIRTWGLALAVAGAGLAVGVAPGMAWSSFCEDDPPVQVVTPAGHNVTVNNFLIYERQDRRLMRHATLYATATPAGPGHTLVVIHVLTPEGGHSAIHVNSKTDRFQSRTFADGQWGTEIDLYLTLDTD